MGGKIVCISSEAAEQKYDWEAGWRGCKAADLPRKAKNQLVKVIIQNLNLQYTWR